MPDNTEPPPPNANPWLLTQFGIRPRIIMPTLGGQGIQHVYYRGDGVTISDPTPPPMPMPNTSRIPWTNSPWGYYNPDQLDSESHACNEQSRVGELLGLPYHSLPNFVPRVQQGARRQAILDSITTQASNSLHSAEAMREYCNQTTMAQVLYAIANQDDEAIRLGLARRLSILMSCFFEVVTQEKRAPSNVEKQRIGEAAGQLHGLRQRWQEKISTHLDKEVARGRYHSREHAFTRMGMPNLRSFESSQAHLAQIASNNQRMNAEQLVNSVAAAARADEG